MKTIQLPWESWRAVIAALRDTDVPYMREHADILERQLERHGPGEPTVRLSLTDDVFLRSSTWARVQLGDPPAADGVSVRCGVGRHAALGSLVPVPHAVNHRTQGLDSGPDGSNALQHRHPLLVDQGG